MPPVTVNIKTEPVDSILPEASSAAVALAPAHEAPPGHAPEALPGIANNDSAGSPEAPPDRAPETPGSPGASVVAPPSPKPQSGAAEALPGSEVAALPDLRRPCYKCKNHMAPSEGLAFLCTSGTTMNEYFRCKPCSDDTRARATMVQHLDHDVIVRWKQMSRPEREPWWVEHIVLDASAKVTALTA